MKFKKLLINLWVFLIFLAARFTPDLQAQDDFFCRHFYGVNHCLAKNSDNKLVIGSGESPTISLISPHLQSLTLTNKNPVSSWSMDLEFKLGSFCEACDLNLSVPSKNLDLKFLAGSASGTQILSPHADSFKVQILSSGIEANCSRMQNVGRNQKLTFRNDISKIRQMGVELNGQMMTWSFTFSEPMTIDLQTNNSEELLNCTGDTIRLSQTLSSSSIEGGFDRISMTSRGYVSEVKIFSHTVK